MLQSLNRFLGPIFLCLFTVLAHAQPQENSPYSRYGLGNVQSLNFAPLSSMGGIYSTYHSPFHVNSSNPASYSRLRYTSFEVAAFGRFSNMRNKDQTLKTHAESGSLGYIALAFPVFNPLNRLTQKKDYPFDWGMSFGLIPYSNVGYAIETEEEDPEFGNAVFNNNGSGQLYKFYYGSGWHTKGFSIGFNTSYLFGKIRDEKTIVFNDLPYSLVNEFIDENNTKGFLLDIGVQYEFPIGKLEEDEKDYRPRVVLGATFTPGLNAASIADKNYVRQNFTAGTLYSDTLLSTVTKDQMTMPSVFSFGIGIHKEKHWRVGLNYEGATWNNFLSPNHLDDLEFAYKVGIGGEYIPEDRSYNAPLKRIRYRLGAFYNTDPRQVSGEQLTNYGITFGFGLPIILPGGNKYTHVNLGLELGRIGTTDIIQENYLKATAAFTLNDNTWFYKRKYK